MTPCTNQAEFISETIPDGSVLIPGQVFTKTWVVKNSGNCTWDTGYALVRVQGEALGAPDELPLSAEAPPGSQIELRVQMTVPLLPGEHTSYWKLRSPDKEYFSLLWLKINSSGGTDNTAVNAPAASTPVPQATPAPLSGAAPLSSGADRFSLLSETIPDGSQLQPGQAFTKTWTLKNTGATTWTEKYGLILALGDAMNGPALTPFGHPTPPGGILEIRLDLTAPKIPGEYITHWQMRTAAGQEFGPLWLNIRIPGGQALSDMHFASPKK